MPRDLAAVARPLDVHAVADWIDEQLAAHWENVLEAHREKLEVAYQRAGDLAFGTYQHLLLRDVKRQLRGSGLTCTPPLPGDFGTSREWGNADETDQERWMWSLLHGAAGEPLGALVHTIPHDHTRFRVPRRPTMFGVAATTREAVEAALGARSAEFAAAPPFHVWYERYLAEQG